MDLFSVTGGSDVSEHATGRSERKMGKSTYCHADWGAMSRVIARCRTLILADLSRESLSQGVSQKVWTGHFFSEMPESLIVSWLGGINTNCPSAIPMQHKLMVSGGWGVIGPIFPRRFTMGGRRAENE
jgi:hypothetical protein